VDPKKLVNGELPADRQISIHSNSRTDGKETTFINLGGSKAFLAMDKDKLSRDISPHRKPGSSLPPVKLDSRPEG
jgi:hypothetical protein